MVKSNKKGLRHLVSFTSKKSNKIKFRRITHFYHIVDRSPWPFCISIGAFSFFLNFVGYLQLYKHCGFFALISAIFVVICFSFWCRDIVRESTFLGKHTSVVVSGIRLGFIIFILSEVFFFLGFFWAFFHCSLDPAISIGCVWPPYGLKPINAFNYSSYFGTSLLLLSGCTLTTSHHFLKHLNDPRIPHTYLGVFVYLALTVFLGLSFLVFQFSEYRHTSFNISDSVYGSLFFMITGFHGFHVLIGTIFLAVQLLRFYFMHFGKRRHLGFELAIWYWHFVDVVWIFVYSCVYVWGSTIWGTTPWVKYVVDYL